jgi:hypothetical protein
MLIEPDFIVQARQEVGSKGSTKALIEFSQVEPALAAFIHESLAATAGRLTLAGAPTPLVQAAHEEVLALVLTCVESQRRGHYEYWKDAMTGTRLGQLDSSLKPRRKRKKKEPPSAAPPAAEG